MDTRTQHADRSWLERVPSWTFLAILGGLIGAAALLSVAFPETFWNPRPGWELDDARCGGQALDEGVLFDYYWEPILCDEGYNAVNTASWAVLLGLLLLWAYRLTVELKETVGTGLILAVVPFLVWGSVYRVLEDADLFAPYSRSPLPTPGNGFLDHSLGVFFITPIIYVEITFIAVGLLLWGHRARRAAQTKGLAHGLQYYAYSLVLLLALYTALWASNPTYIRHVAHPIVAAGAALVSFWAVWRHTTLRGHFSPHVALGAYGLFFLVIGAYYVLVWMTGGVEGWRPDVADAITKTYPPDSAALEAEADARGLNWPVQWWVFVAAIVGPALIAYATWRLGRILGGIGRPPSKAPRERYGPPATALIVLLLLIAVAVFLTILGMQDFAQRQIADAWSASTGRYVRALALLLAGPVAIAAGVSFARRLASGQTGFHPALLHYATPVNLLMVFGQLTDGLMTSLGIDLYHYREKHVLPRFLIQVVEDLNLPEPFGAFPTAMVMIPLKLLIVLVVVLAIDAGARDDLKGRENLVGLVKLGIIMVGLSPGVRDAVRLAMAT